MNARPHQITSLATIVILLSHMTVDISQGAFPALVPVIQETYHLNYSQIGIMVMLMSLTSSICQPIFGIICDKKSVPWFIPVGVLLSGMAMGSIVFAHNYPVLMMLIALSGFGSAIFHPQGMKTSNRISPAQKKGKLMGLFSVGGNLGFAIGSFIVGLLLAAKGGFSNAIWIALPSVLLMPLLIFTYPNTKLTSKIGEKATKKNTENKIPYSFLGIIVFFIFLRSTLHSGINTYTPLYHANFLGQDSIFIGKYISLYAAAGVLGTYMGGSLSDIIGRKTMIILSMLLSIPLVWAIPYVHGNGALLLSAVTGMIVISSFSPILVMAQEQMKNNMGLAGGLVTGLGIGLGGVGASILGNLADIITLPVLLRWLPLLSLGAAAVALFFPGKVGKKSV